MIGRLLHWVTRCCINFCCVRRIDVALDAKAHRGRAGWTALACEHAGRQDRLWHRTYAGPRQPRDVRSSRPRVSPGPRIDQGSAEELDAVRTLPPTSFNAGVPLHVVQRYLGHRSPEMTMHYAATLEQTHEREFLRLTQIGRDGRHLHIDAADIYQITQLDRCTDRILPNGICLLPPTKSCDKGNACARCEHFATDRSHLADHRQQLAASRVLIEQRKAQYLQRTGQPMADDNVWLQARLAENRSLELIIAALENDTTAEGDSVRGAGTAARHIPGNPEPINIDTTRWRTR